MTTSIGTDTRAAVFGYGIEGRSAVRWLRRRGCGDLRVISADRPEDLDPGVEGLYFRGVPITREALAVVKRSLMRYLAISPVALRRLPRSTSSAFV